MREKIRRYLFPVCHEALLKPEDIMSFLRKLKFKPSKAPSLEQVVGTTCHFVVTVHLSVVLSTR